MGESKKYIFEKLTPVNTCDMDVYDSAIDFISSLNVAKFAESIDGAILIILKPHNNIDYI